MKTLLFSYKFLFVTLMSLPLALCSKDNDPKQDFEPITLDLSGLDVKEEDASFSLYGFNFTSFHAKSVENYHSTYQGNDIVFDGIALWHNGTDMSFIDLDLEDVTGVSKITTKVYNNGTVTTVTLYNDEGIVEEIQAEYRVTDVVFDVQNKVIDKLRITSAEGAALSIKLE